MPLTTVALRLALLVVWALSEHQIRLRARLLAAYPGSPWTRTALWAAAWMETVDRAVRRTGAAHEDGW